MNFIDPSVELISELDNFKRIEIAGRTCYKSEAKITDDSAYPFFQRIVKSGHLSVVEHSNIFVMSCSPEVTTRLLSILAYYVELTGKPHYIRYSPLGTHDECFVPRFGYCFAQEYLFSGNIRAWRDIISAFPAEDVLQSIFADHPAFDDIFDYIRVDLGFDVHHDHTFAKIIDNIDGFNDKYADEIEDKHNIITCRVTADRGLIDEYVRHRLHSFSVESTRYCNYSGGDCTYVFPFWYNEASTNEKYKDIVSTLGNACYDAERYYNEIIQKVGAPQVARGALNLWIKSEAVMTATVSNWRNFLNLRCSKAAHPESQKIASIIKEATGL